MVYYHEEDLLRMQALLHIAQDRCPYGDWVVGLEGTADDGRAYTLRMYKDLIAGCKPLLVADIGVTHYDGEGMEARRAEDHQAFLDRCFLGSIPEAGKHGGNIVDVLKQVQMRLLEHAAQIQDALGKT